MITETDEAIYNKLSGIQVSSKTIPVRFMGQEEQFAVNVNWDAVSPYYNVQRYDISFADDGRWAPDDEIYEYNYETKTITIRKPDYPLYLWYQVDCMARYQRDFDNALTPIIQRMPRVGYLNVYAEGQTHTCCFVLVESVNLNELDETDKYRHAFRYRVDIRLKNLTEVETYMVMERVFSEHKIDDTDKIIKTINIVGE